jgi:hypothetical protein
MKIIHEAEYDVIVSRGFDSLRKAVFQDAAGRMKAEGVTGLEPFKLFYDDSVGKLLPGYASIVAEELRARNFPDRISIERELPKNGPLVSSVQDEIMERVPSHEEEISRHYTDLLYEKRQNGIHYKVGEHAATLNLGDRTRDAMASTNEHEYQPIYETLLGRSEGLAPAHDPVEASKYALECYRGMAEKEPDPERRKELGQLIKLLEAYHKKDSSSSPSEQ